MIHESCPCGSGSAYSACCGRFHIGSGNAPTAEALMRSRYSAFAKQEIEYLLATTHANLLPATDRAGLAGFAASVKWLGLQVLDRKMGQVDDQVGKVTFCAWFEELGKLNCIHERSHFEREAGQWKYHSGVQLPRPKIGRNAPCPCGSEKKYKKCHG